MTIISKMRAGSVAMVLAAGTLVGCGAPDQTMTAQGTRVIGRSGITTSDANYSPYSGAESEAALDSVMTGDQGGE